MPKLVLTEILYALSDPLRLKIVRQLAEEGEAACGELEVRMPKSSLSHHFKVLRDAGVIATRAEGVQRINRLRREELDAAFPGLLDAVLGRRGAPSHGAPSHGAPASLPAAPPPSRRRRQKQSRQAE